MRILSGRPALCAQWACACLVLLAVSLASGTATPVLSGIASGCIIAPLAYAFDAAAAQDASGKRRLEHAFAHLVGQFVTDIKRFCGPEFFLR